MRLSMCLVCHTRNVYAAFPSAYCVRSVLWHVKFILIYTVCVFWNQGHSSQWADAAINTSVDPVGKWFILPETAAKRPKTPSLSANSNGQEP